MSLESKSNRVVSLLHLARDQIPTKVRAVDPVINIEDSVGKVVGRRRPASKLLSTSQETEANRQWANAGFFPRIKKGVYKFKTEEEADQWLMDHLTRKQER